MGSLFSGPSNTTPIIVGGAANTKLKQVLKQELMNMLQTNPYRYRVGATTQDIQTRIWSYGPQFSNKTVYFAPTMGPACLNVWENDALSLLPAIPLYNDTKISNIVPGSKGFLYIIDMMS